MADNKTITYTLNLDTVKMEKSLVDINTEIQDLNASQKELSKNNQKGSKEFVDNAEKLKTLKKGYNEQSKVLQNTNKLKSDEVGHLAKLKAELSVVTADINNMSKAELNNINVGGKAIDKQKALTAELKKSEEAGGNFRRSVGDYGKEMDKSNKKFSIFGKLSGGFKNGMKSMSTAVKGFGKALMANPIGIIIGLIVGLIAFMKKALKPFQPLLDWISDKIAYVSGLIDGFVNSLSKLGDIISLVFQGEFVKAAQAADELKNGIAGVAEATENLNKVMREQDAIQKENDLTTLESMAHQKELETILRDTTLSIKKRKEALEELKGIQEGQAQDDINEKLARYNAVNEKINATLRTKVDGIKDITKVSSDQLADLRNAGDLTQDQFDELISARKELAIANAAAADVDLRLSKYSIRLKREEVAAEKAATKEKEEDRKKAYAKKLADLKKLNEQIDKEIQDDIDTHKEAEKIKWESKLAIGKISQKEYNDWLIQAEIEALKESKEFAVLSEQEKLDAVAAIRIAYKEEERKAEKITETEWQKLADEEKASAMIASAKGINDSLSAIADAQRDLELTKIKNQYNEQDKLANESYENEASRLKEQFKNGIISQASYDSRINSLKETFDAEQLVRDNNRKAAEDAALKEAFDKNKKFQIASIIMNAASAAIQAFNTVIPQPAGGILSAIQAGLIAATAAAQIATVQQTQFSAASGGILPGPLHAAGGINMGAVEAEGGEFVINRASTQAYTPLLNSINAAGNASGNVNEVNQIIDYDKLAAAQSAKKVYVVSHEMSEQQDEDTKITDRIEF